MYSIQLWPTRFFLVITLLLSVVCARGVSAGEEHVAIQGYDPVSYFTDGRPVKGDDAFSFVWQGARYQFSSAAHRSLFAADPDHYAPQYAGYCALSMTTGTKYEGDPTAWAIVDGKLYLNGNESARDQFRQNVTANVQKANENWAKLKD